MWIDTWADPERELCLCGTVSPLHWRRKWRSTPVFLPGESHGWRSLVGYSPWNCKELDTTEWLMLSLFFFFFTCCVSCLVPSFLVWVETPLAWPASYHSQICPCRCTQSSHLHYFPYSLLFYMITGTPPVGWNHRPRVKEETWHEDIVRVKVCLFSCQGTDWLHVLFCRFLSGTWDPFHSLAALIDKHQPWNLQPTYFW